MVALDELIHVEQYSPLRFSSAAHGAYTFLFDLQRVQRGQDEFAAFSARPSEKAENIKQ